MESHHIAAVFLVLLAGIGVLNAKVEGMTKRSVSEPKALVGEPAPIEGDCPCSKIACVGDKGPKGDLGVNGATGPKGPKGNQGATGPEGRPGDRGYKGVQGPIGSPGTPGKTGAPGNAGTAGLKGEQGGQGLQGKPGARGPQGIQGDKGSAGPTGPPGVQGLKGDKGDNGKKGDTGNQGPRGLPGAKGPQGPQGGRGTAGLQGPRGLTGPKGPTGSVGLTGPKGAQGSSGATGARGPQGLRGITGSTGAKGPRGPPGGSGPRGSQGPQGPPGRQGTPGSCANQCAGLTKQLEAKIDALKKYTVDKVNHLQKQIAELHKQRPTPTPTPTKPPPHHYPLGSVQNPAKSCRDILAKIRHTGSGAYWLKTETAAHKSLVYCLMDSKHLGMCGGGGWTLVMKLNGHAQTFRYSSPLWSNRAEHQPRGGRTGFDSQETKVATYWSTPFHSICLGMSVSSTLRFVRFKYSAKSLYSVIADGKYRPTRIGRNVWKNLVPSGSLQPRCNREGFNVNFGPAVQVRIGIASNQENDCRSCDSRIGFGTAGSHCGQQNTNSCGNEARCSPDMGDRSTRAYGYIFVK